VTAVDKAPPKRKNIKFLVGEPPKLLQISQGDMEEFVKGEAANGQKYDRISVNNWHLVKNPGEMINGLKKLLKNDGVIEISLPTDGRAIDDIMSKRTKKALLELAPVLFNIEEVGGKYTLTHKA